MIELLFGLWIVLVDVDYLCSKVNRPTVLHLNVYQILLHCLKEVTPVISQAGQ